VALAAALLGIRAVVVVPATGSPAKLAAIEGYGAEIRRYDPATERREEVAGAVPAGRCRRGGAGGAVPAGRGWRGGTGGALLAGLAGRC
jgi:hypothetical protein